MVFAFGFAGDDYLDKALNRGWLVTDDGQTSPAVMAHTNELNLELNLEPVKGLRIQLTANRTDNRTTQVQFMYADMPTAYAGAYTKTHCAISTALRSARADNGYASDAFSSFLSNIPVVRERIEGQYAAVIYPNAGFIKGTP